MESNPLAQLYISRDEKVEIDCIRLLLMYSIDNQPYTNLKRRIEVLPFNQLGGLRPYDKEESEITTARKFNKEIDLINSTEESKESFYRGLQLKAKKEIKYLTQQNRKDHIKGIDSTLNFKSRPTQFTSSYIFTKEKENETNNPDSLYHYKKSFMKTYEESKLKHLIILRK